MQSAFDHVIRDHRARHEDRAVGQIKNPLDTKHQRKTEREKRVNAADYQAVQKLLR